ncbi:MAG: hypothetical protein LBP37_04755 [Spirochaetaceae bacterium]|nr:hypothetical protein [Spirochaetaceae bacterium]
MKINIKSCDVYHRGPAMNRQARSAGFLALMLCSTTFAAGFGGDEKETRAEQRLENKTVKPDVNAPDSESALQNSVVHVYGRVRLVGSGVFPELVISGENREWYINKDEQSKLMEFQQRFVTVEGMESYIDIKFANGLPAGRRYTLKNIKIINVDR